MGRSCRLAFRRNRSQIIKRQLNPVARRDFDKALPVLGGDAFAVSPLADGHDFDAHVVGKRLFVREPENEGFEGMGLVSHNTRRIAVRGCLSIPDVSQCGVAIQYGNGSREIKGRAHSGGLRHR